MQALTGEETHAILRASAGSYAHAWQTHFGCEHDPSQLLGELNIFRYRPCRRIILRIEQKTSPIAAAQVILAAATTGVPLEISVHAAADSSWLNGLSLAVVEEDEAGLIERLKNDATERLRLPSPPSRALREAANLARVHVMDAPVLAHGRLELRHYLREQSISQTVHRYGNLMSVYAQPHQGDGNADPRQSHKAT